MAVINNGLPATNLKADDIRDTLNANGGSVTNDTLTFFKAAAKINKWSKWKPQHVPNADFVDDEATFKEYNWGIDISGLKVRDTGQAFAGSKESDWVYVLPKGGAASPYRMGDFRNYRADATPPFRELEVSHVVAVAGDAVTTTLWCRMFNDSNEKGMLGLSDIGDFFDYDVAFLHKKPNNTIEVKHSTDKLGSTTSHGSISATFPNFSTSTSEEGTHTYMAALHFGGDYIPLPIAPKTVKVEKSKVNDLATLSASIWSDVLEAKLSYLRGTSNSTSISLSPTFYFGDANSQWIMVPGSSVQVSPGNTGVSKCTIDKYQYNTNYWQQVYDLAAADNLYVRCSAGGGTVKVNILW